MESTISGETINYADYGQIIHFGSSIILDIYQKGFDLRNVITLNMNYAVQPITEGLFNNGYNIPLFAENMESKFNEILEELEYVR